MKKFLFVALFSLGFFCTEAQIIGNFERTDEGYVYFVLENNTNESFSIRYTARNHVKFDTKTQSIWLNAGDVIYFGPEQINWIWESGETFTIKQLSNGAKMQWTCPYTDSRVSYQNTVVVPITVPIPIITPAPRPQPHPAPRPQPKLAPARPQAPMAPTRPQQRPPQRRGIF